MQADTDEPPPLADLEAAVHRSPGDANARYAEAIPAFDKATQYRPTSARLWSEVGGSPCAHP